MDSVIFFDKISIAPPREKIYRRLGFKKKISSIPANRQKETDFFINEASALIALRGMYLRLPIRRNDGRKIWLTEELDFESEKLAVFLRDCREILLMGATAGSAVMEAIRKKTLQEDLTAAVVYDATASETTDAALDWMMDYFNQLLRREGKILLPRRFSAGYADFNLENQKIIHEKLQMEKFGVKINSSFILTPEKSVTAIGGIR